MRLEMSAKYLPFCLCLNVLTHWGRVTHICISKLTIIGSDNGLSPGRRQAIIWTSDGILLNGPLGTNFSEIVIKIIDLYLKKMKMSSGKWRPSCLGLNVLITRSFGDTVMTRSSYRFIVALWPAHIKIQCGAVITRSIFLKILTTDTL